MIARMLYHSDLLFIVLLLSGWLADCFLFRIVPCFKGYFSISEVILYPKWVLLLLYLLLTPTSSLPTRVALAVVLLSILLTVFVLVLYAVTPSLQQTPSLLYALIAAGAAIEIQSLSYLVDQPFISWFIQWLFEVTGEWNSFSLKRVGLLGYWALCLTLFFILLNQGVGSAQRVILQRKYFHYLCVVLFVPGIVMDVAFMR